MLKKVRRIKDNMLYAYAPPAEDAVIQTNELIMVTQSETRRSEPCVRLLFRDGSQMDCLGRPQDFLDSAVEDSDQRSPSPDP